MAKKKKKAEKTCNIRIFCDIYYRYCSEFQENKIDFTVDNILTAAVDSDSKEVYDVVNKMKDSSTFSRILSGKRAITGLVWDFYDSPGAIDVIHGKLTKAFRFIPYKSQAAFCLTLFDAIYEMRVVSSLGLDYLYELMKEDEYSFVCEALLFFATTMEPSRWKETLRAENRTYSARVINCPLAYNSDFMGRDDVFAKIEKAFGGAYIISLTGIIGVGKTQVALMYAHKNNQSYDYILWVNAINKKAIISDYVKILSFFHNLKDYKYEYANDNTIISDFHRLTNQTNNWLIIYDGFSGDYSLKGFIPEASSNGKVLITTCIKGSISGAKEIEVERLTVDNSLLFLDQDINNKTPQEIDGAKNLIYALGNLPLAISHAKHYLSINTSDTYETYLELLNEYGTELIDRFSPDPKPETALCQSILATFSIIEKQYPNSALFLRICAFLASDCQIELGMFETYAKNNKCLFSKEMRRVFRDKLAFRELLYPLLRYSICNAITFSCPCYWSDGDNDTCIIINKLTLDVIRNLSESVEYFEIANDMIYRTSTIATHKQAIEMLRVLENWKGDAEYIYLPRPYTYNLFQNSMKIELSQLSEKSLFKILFSVLEQPPCYRTKEVRDWIKNDIIKALSLKCESFFGCLIYNFLILLIPIIEKKTSEEFASRFKRVKEALDIMMNNYNIADKSVIDNVNSFFEQFLMFCIDEPSSNSIDDSVKMLKRLVEWGNDNRKRQKPQIFIDRIDTLSDIIEKSFLSNYLDENMKAAIGEFRNINSETCPMDKLSETWSSIASEMKDPDCVFIKAYKRISTALDDYRKNSGQDFILPSSFNKLMQTYSAYMCFFFGQDHLDIEETEFEVEDFITGRYDFSDGWASDEKIKRMNAGFLFEDFSKLLDIESKASEYYLRYFETLNLIRSMWQ
ncbi:MAG: TTC39/IML2 family protein [Ruminococcus sp.]|uniref:NB-ARC domain-containing protein n=1 Tax=Ruminococcus sp. TaxID=41978 RepID=UPI0025E6943B|nr:NB-ARC domain-containing protein [Ruminococcus sp.]MCR4794903.1 TTC39/IML2 family protein [Ruminococcus sp.]